MTCFVQISAHEQLQRQMMMDRFQQPGGHNSFLAQEEYLRYINMMK